jgi:hypothetical protein
MPSSTQDIAPLNSLTLLRLITLTSHHLTMAAIPAMVVMVAMADTMIITTHLNTLQLEAMHMVALLLDLEAQLRLT